MNNTNHKLSHLKPGKLYQYIGFNNFYCFSSSIKNLIKINNLDVLLLLENVYKPAAAAASNKEFKEFPFSMIHLKFLYKNTIVGSSFAETSLTESYLHNELVLLT